ncbi:CHAT domain-containing protein [Nonomuraea sp. NPDC003201]
MGPDELLRLAEDDPARLMMAATRISELARADGRLELASVAERALGVAAVHVLDLSTAAAHLRTAMGLARRARSPELAAEARIRLAFVLSSRGRSLHALDEIDQAQAHLHGVGRARAEAQRAAVFNHLGRYGEALASYRLAVPALRRAGDQLWLQRVLSNRAIVRGYQREFAAAEADLLKAEELCRLLRLDLSLAIVWLNLGWLTSIRGDVPTALARFEAAEERFRALGTHQLAWLLSDRSELLLSVGLVDEAREVAQEAVTELVRRKRAIGLPEVRLRLARVAALQDDHEVAIYEAWLAAAQFARQRRPGWAELARFVVLRSRAARSWASDPGQATVRAGVSGSVAAALGRAGPVLAASGWPAEAVEARLLAAHAAIARGHQEDGHRHLAEAARTRLRGPALPRARGWYAEALLRLAKSNRSGALSAIRTGLRILDDHRATLGATDLRAHSARFRVDLAGLGLRLALEQGTARAVLGWAEQGRASHLLLPRARPPEDPVLLKWLIELRATVRDIEERRGPGSARRRQIALERTIRDYTRKLPAGSREPGHEAVRRAVLAEALGDHALIEYIQQDELLYAITLAGGRLSLRPLGPTGPVRDLIDRIPFALRRMHAAARGSREAARAMLANAGARLDEILLRPMARELADRPLVVVPTGALQTLAWSVLPSCAGRAVTVSPSATLWHTARSTPGADGPIFVASGPDLPYADGEARVVAEIYGTTALTGHSSGVDEVLRRMDGARLAHLAAHGRLRRGNPLFSSLRLADGWLTIYDLERLHRAPSMVVLAACDSGRPVVRAGDELLGLSTTFLALGTRTIVAAVVSVPDTETAALMIEMHKLLAKGRSAAESLAIAHQHAPSGFICLGADSTLR